MISSRKLDGCQQAADAINAKVGEERVLAHACNAGYKDQLQALVDATHSRIGKIDILVGNAGVNPAYGPMSSIADEAFDKTMSTNVKANHWLIQMVAPDMVERGSGSIMITSSVGAFAPSLVLGTYNISKLAVIGLMRNIAAELGPKGVRPHPHGFRGGTLEQPGGRGTRQERDPDAASRGGRGPHGARRVPGLGLQRVRNRAGDQRLRRLVHVGLRPAPSARND